MKVLCVTRDLKLFILDVPKMVSPEVRVPLVLPMQCVLEGSERVVATQHRSFRRVTADSVMFQER